MKKAIIAASAAIILAAGAAASWTAFHGSEDKFFNENLEALMDAESGTGTCFDSIQTAPGERVLYCGSCSWQPGTPSFWSKQGNC